MPKPHRRGPQSVATHHLFTATRRPLASPPVSHPIIPLSTVGLNIDAISFVQPLGASVCAVSHGQASGTCISADAGTSNSRANPCYGYHVQILSHPQSLSQFKLLPLEGQVVPNTLISFRAARGGKAGEFELVQC